MGILGSGPSTDGRRRGSVRVQSGRCGDRRLSARIGIRPLSIVSSAGPGCGRQAQARARRVRARAAAVEPGLSARTLALGARAQLRGLYERATAACISEQVDTPTDPLRFYATFSTKSNRPSALP